MNYKPGRPPRGEAARLRRTYPAKMLDKWLVSGYRAWRRKLTLRGKAETVLARITVPELMHLVNNPKD